MSLSAFYFIIFMAGGAFSNYVALYYVHVGLTTAQIGMISSLAAIVTVFVQPFWGTIADRAKTKNRIICVAIVGSAAMVWLLPLADATVLGIFLAFTAFTVFQCAYNPLADATTLEICQKHKFNFSTIRTMGSLGFALAAFVAGHLIARNIMFIFPVFSGLMLFALFTLIFIPKVAGHQNKGDKANKHRFTDVLKHKRLVIIYIYALVIMTTMSFAFSFHAIYSAEIGITADIIGTGVMIGSIAQFPFMLLFPKIVKKVPLVFVLCASGLVHAARWLLYAYALNEVTIYFICALHGFCFMVFYLCLTEIVSKTVPPELRASGQTMNALVILGLSRIIGSALGGFGGELIGLQSVFAISGVLCIVATLVFFVVVKIRKFEKEF